MTTTANTDYIYFREFGYDLFRRLFMEEPTPELLRFLQQHDLVALFPDLHRNSDFIHAAESINHYLHSQQFVAGSDIFENLHWDFTRLFIGPEKLPAPPWESVYVSRDKLLFQHCTNEVKRTYEENGFFLDEEDIEAADHIGFELDFLYHLSALTISLFEQHNADRKLLEIMNLQHNFLQQHLLAFSAQFSENVQLNAETPFYRYFGLILQLFLTADKRQLERSMAALKILSNG